MDLEGEVYSTWDLWISGLQECKGNGFFKAGRAGGHKFLIGSRNPDFFMGACPCPNLPPLKSSWGDEGGG